MRRDRSITFPLNRRIWLYDALVDFHLATPPSSKPVTIQIRPSSPTSVISILSHLIVSFFIVLTACRCRHPYLYFYSFGYLGSASCRFKSRCRPPQDRCTQQYLLRTYYFLRSLPPHTLSICLYPSQFLEVNGAADNARKIIHKVALRLRYH